MLPPTTVPSQPPHVGCSVFKCIRVFFILVSYIIILAGFIFQVGGVYESYNQCKDDNFSGSTCEPYRFDAWVIAFQFGVALFVLVISIIGCLERMATAIIIYLSVSITQQALVAEIYLDLRKFEDSYKTAAAGFILASFGDILLGCIVGLTKVPEIKIPLFFRPRPRMVTLPQAQVNRTVPQMYSAMAQPQVQNLPPGYHPQFLYGASSSNQPQHPQA